MSAGRDELIKKITAKKEFSELPKKDVSLALSKFDNPNLTDEEKVKSTRDLLRKVYTAFLSKKLLVPRDKTAEWFLKKHISTKERLLYYPEIYSKIFEGLPKKAEVYDLGCGTNGFSYDYFGRAGFDMNYTGVEAVGQVVNAQNKFFEKDRRVNFLHESLFDLEKMKRIIRGGKMPKIVLLFKVVDSLEMLERDYSKKLFKEIVPLASRVVVSFATRSLVKKRKFFAERKWFVDFVKKEFKIIKEFKAGGEKYLVFSKKDL